MTPSIPSNPLIVSASRHADARAFFGEELRSRYSADYAISVLDARELVTQLGLRQLCDLDAPTALSAPDPRDWPVLRRPKVV